MVFVVVIINNDNVGMARWPFTAGFMCFIHLLLAASRCSISGSISDADANAYELVLGWAIKLPPYVLQNTRKQ